MNKILANLDAADIRALNEKLTAEATALKAELLLKGIQPEKLALPADCDFVSEHDLRSKYVETLTEDLRRVKAATPNAPVVQAADLPVSPSAGFSNLPAEAAAGGDTLPATLTAQCRKSNAERRAKAAAKQPAATPATAAGDAPVVAVSNAQKKEAKEQGKPTINLTQACLRAETTNTPETR